MQQFAIGFIVALLVSVPAVVFYLRKRASTDSEHSNEFSEQFENLSKLTGELAHEIKNPLSTIKINLKLTAEELENPDFTESGAISRELTEQKLSRASRKISVIQKEADRLEQILDSFLRYMDRTQLQLERVDVNELVSDMIDFYSPQGQSHSITIRQGLCNETLICKVDTDMLKQVLLNLFINSQQAMKNGGELIIRTSRQDKQAAIEVSDTGCGISADKLVHVFDVYYSSRSTGSGLGLPTAKKIVEAHKGEITVNSEVGRGTSFIIKLPLVFDD